MSGIAPAPATVRFGYYEFKLDHNGGTLSVQEAAETFSGVKTFSATPVLATGTTLNLGSTTGTFSSSAVTITEYAAILTTESLTTAHTAAATLVVTKTGVAAGDLAFISLMGGTNTQGVPLFKAVCTTDTVTITLLNAAISTNAFNGTFIFALFIVKA